MEQRWPRDAWLDALWEAEDVKPNERCVAYVYARYAGRSCTSWCAWTEIGRRTGIRSKDAINRAIRGLIEDKWLTEEEPARQHRSAVYRLTTPTGTRPEVRDTDSSEVRDTDSSIPEVRETAPEVRETGTQRYGKRDASTQIDLSEEASSRAREDQPDTRDRLSARDPTEIVMEATGCSRQEAAAVAALIEREKQPRALAAFLHRLASDGELPVWLDRVRAEQTRVDLSTWRRGLAMKPNCPHEVPGGRELRPDNGKPWCVLCQRRAARGAA